MKSQEVDHSKFKELHQIPNGENYVILEIVPITREADNILADTITENLLVNSFYEPKLKPSEDVEYNTLKIDFLANNSSKVEANTILRNGTIWNAKFYSNWIINGDSTKYKYRDPLSNTEILNPYEYAWKEKDFTKWLKIFNDLYVKADYVFIDISFYYFKIGNLWFMLNDTLEESPKDFRKKYPPKEDQNIRMLELENMFPSFSVPPEERDTRLVKEIDYESMYEEEVDKGVFSYGFSAGWWYLEIYMPFGDTIRVKRYSDFKSPNMQLYKIPAAYGGRNDVYFIVQKPEELFPEQVGGMYVIRPRDIKQPERRFKRISYGDTSKGQPYILRAEESDEYKEWKVRGKG